MKAEDANTITESHSRVVTEENTHVLKLKQRIIFGLSNFLSIAKLLNWKKRGET